jgi:hypothetical protein
MIEREQLLSGERETLENDAVRPREIIPASANTSMASGVRVALSITEATT